MDIMNKPRPGAPKLKRTLIWRASLLLFGRNWRAGLAHSLGVSPRTISRWANGETEPPRELDCDLIRMCRQRHHALGLVLADLEAHKTKRLDSERRQA